MLKTILLALALFSPFGLNLFALDISIQGARQNHQSYSTLHLKDANRFLCQEIKDDFDEIVKIVCAFSQAPSKEFKKVQNEFFKIDSEIKNKTFFIIITPYERMKLIPVIFNLTKDDIVFDADVKISDHWMILGYKKKIPFLKKNSYSEMAINFPFQHNSNKLPYVGGLDIYGNPVHIKKVDDVKSYLKIKQLFKNERYEVCLDLIDEITQKYPNTLFMAELLYYKIKVFMQLKDYDSIVDISKIFLREYSSDENVAEVLALSSKAYSKMGMNTDALYFFDRLFSEHPDSVFAKWGYIYKGEMLESSGGVSKAVVLYKKAFNETKNIDVAASAAYKLANLYVNNSNSKEGAKYIQKIAKAKPKYFVKDYLTSTEMMYDFVDVGDYKSAATIAECLVDNIKTNHDDHESLLKNVGIWLSKTDNKKDALKALNRYLKEYDDGLYINEVQVAKDSLFFDVGDENLTTTLKNYTDLIGRYENDSIGSRAVYEKAKLLLENKMFNDVLDLETELLVLDNQTYTDVNKIINEAAIGAMKKSLKSKNCQGVLKISTKYKIKLSDKWDDGIYECAMKGGDYSLATNISDKHLKSKDLDQRKKWLFRYIEVDFATGKYKNVIKASRELILLIKDDKNSKYKKVYRIIFDAYHILGNTIDMINSIADIKKIYGVNYKDIDRYVAMVALGDKSKDDNLIIKYANEVVNIQKMSNSYAQSPFIEFALYQAYMNKENYNKALEIISSLNNIKLNNLDRSRQKYLLGSIYSRLWREDDAQVAYKESIAADKNSPWAELAKGAIGL